MESIDRWVERIIISLGVSETTAPYIRLLALLVIVGLLAWLFFYITKRIVNVVLS